MDLSNLSDFEIIIIITIVVAILYKLFNKKKDKPDQIEDEAGRIKDEFVNTDNVLEVLSSFKVKYQSNLKDGYTEKSIQKQLKKHLLDHFVNVVDEYGIEGINPTKIDFDIGKGQVGLELKIARSIFKTRNLYTLSGQIDDYMKQKYDNLIVVVFGEPIHSDERTMLARIQEIVEEKNAIYYYHELPKKKKQV